MVQPQRPFVRAGRYFGPDTRRRIKSSEREQREYFSMNYADWRCRVLPFRGHERRQSVRL